MNCLVLMTMRALGETTYPVIVNNVADENEAIKVAISQVDLCALDNPEDVACISKVEAIELYTDILVIDNKSCTDEV